MEQAQISPGWALFAILILWGLAGALDEPIEDTGSPEQPPAAEPFRAIPTAVRGRRCRHERMC